MKLKQKISTETLFTENMSKTEICTGRHVTGSLQQLPLPSSHASSFEKAILENGKHLVSDIQDLGEKDNVTRLEICQKYLR